MPMRQREETAQHMFRAIASTAPRNGGWQCLPASPPRDNPLTVQDSCLVISSRHQEPAVTSTQRGILLVCQTHGQGCPFRDLWRKGRTCIDDGGLISASLVLGRSQELGDAAAVMVLPQTPLEPALPSIMWKGNFQYNYRIVRFSNSMGIGQTPLSKIHFWTWTPGNSGRKQSLAVPVLVCRSRGGAGAASGPRLSH